MGIVSRLKAIVKIMLWGTTKSIKPTQTFKESKTSVEYWTGYNVTLHHQFKDRKESLNYLRWRFDQYPGYEKLMPCNGQDDKVILDYGCGPGHDIVGFVEYSKPSKVIAMDVSSSSLEQAKNRIKLHNANNIVDFKLIVEKQPLPVESNSVDYIHSSGVLHHTPNMDEILKELYRILKPDGKARIMIYNKNSIWCNLYVPYILQIKGKLYQNDTFQDAFRKSTDGEDCPISNCYTPDEYIEICNKAGFKTKFIGAAVSLDELNWLSEKNNAMKDILLSEEHRVFLRDLTFNSNAYPLYKGCIAGIDAVFELSK